MTLAAVAIYFVACTVQPTQTHHSTPLPLSIRADTRNFVGLTFDTTKVNAEQLRAVVVAALPNETSMCFYGYAKDTTYTAFRRDGPITGDSVEVTRKIAVIDSMAPSNIKSSNPISIFYKDGIACDPNPRLIGIGHTHPLQNSRMGPCDHSRVDTLFGHGQQTKYWFMMVFCSFGHSVLWADGRRVTF
jgi:hypothetical protein